MYKLPFPFDGGRDEELFPVLFGGSVENLRNNPPIRPLAVWEIVVGTLHDADRGAGLTFPDVRGEEAVGASSWK